MTVPEGYVALRAPGVRVVVRTDLAEAAGAWLLGTPLALPAGSTPLPAAGEPPGASRCRAASGRCCAAIAGAALWRAS